jgi:hypothetical protein
MMAAGGAVDREHRKIRAKVGTREARNVRDDAIADLGR